jgi:hypothetical protein
MRLGRHVDITLRTNYQLNVRNFQSSAAEAAD